MAQWARIKFYYDSIPGEPGAAISASSEDADAPAANVANMLEVNRWRAGSLDDPQYLSVDLGPGKSKAADYLAIIGHNLSSSGAALSLEYSSDGFAADINEALSPFLPLADKVVLKEFSQTAEARHWRLKIAGHTMRPHIAVCAWGLRTELDYATASFDPHAEDAKADINISHGGYVTGVHARYVERSMTLRFDDAGPELYEKVRQWRESSGLKNFFVAWEGANNPDDVFLMRPSLSFFNPLKAGGRMRDITVALTGRKE